MSVSSEQGNRIVRLIIFGFVLQLGLVAYVFATGYHGRVALVESQRADCERDKLDRIDNARFQAAHTEYIHKVVLAKSVEEDVKSAARDAVDTYDITSKDLVDRSKTDCEESIPDASFLP